MTKRRTKADNAKLQSIDLRNPELNPAAQKRTLVTLKQLEGYLNICGRTITRYVDEGILPPPVRFGPRCVRYDLDATLAAARAHIDGCIEGA